MVRLSFIAIIICCIALGASCTRNAIYNEKYHSMPDANWLQRDTLHFSVPPIEEDGIYESFIGIRLTDRFPYANLTLRVEQQFFPSAVTDSQTIKCQFTDQHGVFNGTGVGLHEYSFPINMMKLNAGDSIQATICHIMNKDTIPQITEVGYIVKKR